MFNTYCNMYIQFIFAARYRESLIQKQWKEDLHQFLVKVMRANYHKMLQVNSMPDHVHLLINVRPTQSIDSLAGLIKNETEQWIKMKRFHSVPFVWQDGYAAFSYSEKSIPGLIRQIQNQEQHHKKVSFLDEYKYYLDEYEIDYEEKDLFTEPEPYGGIVIM